MRTYNKLLISCLLCIIISFTSFTRVTATDYEMRACWISYIDIQNKLKDLSEEEFIATYRAMLKLLIDNNINTVIVQVRPMGDAIYPSDIFPWSRYICSDSKGLSYDPLKIMIEESHREGIRFEAWINPYRLSLGDETTEYYKKLDNYTLYKDIILEYCNNLGEHCLSLNPAEDKAIELIYCGVYEIVTGYNVDGIHFDDYFYVEGMGDEIPADTRKCNVNKLISKVYNGIKDVREDCEFGISPAGNLDYSRQQGADIDTWLSQPGYVDYIMPQIYWSDYYLINNENVCMFSDTCTKWKEINLENKEMYVGLALYKVGSESETDTGWKNSDSNLVKQYEIAQNNGFDGYGLFRYQYIEDELTYEELNNLKASTDNSEYCYSFITGLVGGYMGVVLPMLINAVSE